MIWPPSSLSHNEHLQHSPEEKHFQEVHILVLKNTAHTVIGTEINRCVSFDPQGRYSVVSAGLGLLGSVLSSVVSGLVTRDHVLVAAHGWSVSFHLHS